MPLIHFLLFAVLVSAEAVGSTSSHLLYVAGTDLVAPEAQNSVYRVDLENRSVVPFDEGTLPLLDVQQSPDNTYVAIRRTKAEYHWVGTKILNAKGKQVVSRSSLYPGFAWAPTGHTYVGTDSYYDDSAWHSLGTWSSEPEKDRTDLCDGGFHVHWATFDGRIYIRMNMTKGPVVAYDPKTKKTEDTPYKDILFSPDGKYYYAFTDEAVGLFLRETNENVTQRHAFLKTEDAKSQPRWVGKSLLVFSAAKKPDQEYLFNADDGQALLVPGKILAMGKDDKRVYVSTIPNGAIDEIPMDKLEIFHQEQAAAPK